MLRVVQRGQQLGLPLETGQALGIGGEVDGQDLDRHLAVQRGVSAFQTTPIPPSPIFSTSR